MKNINIKLDSIDKVKKFVNIISNFNSNLDLTSSRYVVDAKSIMGIFSLDLANTLTLTVHEDSEFDEIYDKLRDFVV